MVASCPDIVRIACFVDPTTAINQDDIMSGRKAIHPPSFIGSPRYPHHNFQSAIAIVRQYHKPELFFTFSCNPQSPEITHFLFSNHQKKNRSDSKFHLLLNKLYNKCVTLAEPLLFFNMIKHCIFVTIMFCWFSWFLRRQIVLRSKTYTLPVYALGRQLRSHRFCFYLSIKTAEN